MNFFNPKETAEILGITERTVQRRCKKLKVRKKDNVYLISDELIEVWRLEKRTPNDTPNDMSRHVSFEAEKNELLKLNDERLKMLHEMKVENVTYRKDNENLKAKILELETENTQLKKPMDLKVAIDIVTIEAARQGVTHRIYSNEEFEELIGTIALSETQQEQIKYLRDRIDKQDAALISIAKQVEQRNFIEAMDKGYNKK